MLWPSGSAGDRPILTVNWKPDVDARRAPAGERTKAFVISARTQNKMFHVEHFVHTLLCIFYPSQQEDKAMKKLTQAARKQARRFKGLRHAGVKPKKRRTVSLMAAGEFSESRDLYKPRKQRVTIRLDADVLAWFRAQGPGYQTRINHALYAYMRAGGGSNHMQ